MCEVVKQNRYAGHKADWIHERDYEAEKRWPETRGNNAQGGSKDSVRTREAD